MIKKIFYSFSIVIFLFLAIVKQVSANENFEFSLHSIYSVNQNADTYVEHTLQIKNLSPTFYINSYGLKLSSKDIRNVKVFDGSKEIPAEVVNGDKYSSIGVTFPDEVVGKDKIRTITISYKDPNISLVNGKVLEVTIPQLANTNTYQNLKTTIITPKKFGAPSRVNLDHRTQVTNDDIITTFENTAGKGISIIFGEEQIFNLKLNFHLENPNDQTAITQIALPPDTAFQTMHYHSLEPSPEDIKIDEDGNWIATYKLAANSQTVVKLDAQALISLKIQNPSLGSSFSNKDLKANKYWEINDNNIQALSQDHQGPEAIYDFVINKLDYTKEDINQDFERLGASKVLIQSGQATCQEFTDLFITLARAQKIPARRITGYAYSQNEELRPLGLIDVLHAWPEYYDQEQKRWVAVDPTWGDTTNGVDYFNQFDLNHLVFAINSKSSELPYPAGSYKNDQKESKDLEIEFTENFPQINPDIEIQLQPKKFFFFSIPGLYQINFHNKTGRAWYQNQLNFEGLNSKLEFEFNKKIDEIKLLPFQSSSIPITIYNKKGLISQEKIKIIINNQSYSNSYEFVISSISKKFEFFYNPIVLTAMAAIIIIITLATGSLFIFRRKK
ncbi:MAG: transglutaminase-like domain-containing protein [Candidatus Woesebacteria bacterium]|jgi:hypothetical protein